MKWSIRLALAAGLFFWAGPVNAKTAILVNGLGVYTKPGMMGPIKGELEKRGYRVVVLNHIEAAYLTEMPHLAVCHSLGCNVILNRAADLPAGKRPKLIITIDPGRFESRAPKGARVVNLYCPYHPIGGQYVSGAENVRVCGILHSFMPLSSTVVGRVIKEVDKP